MGLSWQQGPLAPGAAGRFLTPAPLPERLLYAEPLRRRMRVRFGDAWIADSEDVVLLHEPGRYPVAYFPLGDIADGVLEDGRHVTSDRDLGATSWYTVRAGEHSKARAAWRHTELPEYAAELAGRVAFAWRAMDAFYEEDQRIVGAPLVRSARRRGRVRSRCRRPADVLPLQGAVQLLRYRRCAPGRLVLPGCMARGRARRRLHLVRAGQGRGDQRRPAAAAGTRPERDRARRRP
jgi:uncharacterized protein (DUF427 family)